MNQSWYVSENGKAKGPFTKDEIEAQIKGSHLNSESLVFRDGEKVWTKLSEVSEFKKSFQASLTPNAVPASQVNEEKKWVLLVRQSLEGGPKFQQYGPLTKNEVISKIQSGEAKWTDHVWQTGYKSWKKAAEEPEINDRMTEAFTTPGFPLPSDSFIKKSNSEGVVKAVVEEMANDTQPFIPSVNPSQPQTITQKPSPEAATPLSSTNALSSLANAQFKIETNPVEEVKKLNIEPPKLDTVAAPVTETSQVSVIHSAPTTEESTHSKGGDVTATDIDISRKWTKPEWLKWPSFANFKIPQLPHIPKPIFWGLSFGGVAMVLAVSLLMSAPEEPTVEPLTPPPPPNANAQRLPPPPPPGAVPPAPQTEVSRDVAAQKPAEVKASKFVKIKPLKLDSADPQLVFETNAEVGEAIQVEITGITGQILEFVRYEKSSPIARGPNEVPVLRLNKWALPAGSYKVMASVAGSDPVTTTVFIGKKNREFAEKLKSHNKRIAAQRAKEKAEISAESKRLLAMAKDLEKNFKATKKASPEWRKFYAAWSRKANQANKGFVSAYQPSKKDKFVYFENLSVIKKSRADLIQFGRKFNDIKTQSRAPASAKPSLDEFYKQLNQVTSSMK